MIVSIRLFARAKDLAGAEAIFLELQPDATVADLRRLLGLKVPALAGLLARSALAVNDEFAGDSQPVPPDAAIALLPPVSGG